MITIGIVDHEVVHDDLVDSALLDEESARASPFLESRQVVLPELEITPGLDLGLLGESEASAELLHHLVRRAVANDEAVVVVDLRQLHLGRLLLTRRVPGLFVALVVLLILFSGFKITADFV